MNFFTDKKIIKRIIIAILLVTIVNFISPTISKANINNEIGGGLFVPISQFLRAAGDWIIEGLQSFFIGEETIKNGDIYEIKYSPGVIFSGNVPALNINFFNPPTFYKDVTQKRYLKSETYLFLEEGINFDVEGKLNGSDDAVVQTIGQKGIKEKLESQGYILENFTFGYTIGEKEEMETEDPNYNGYRITVWL